MFQVQNLVQKGLYCIHTVFHLNLNAVLCLSSGAIIMLCYADLTSIFENTLAQYILSIKSSTLGVSKASFFYFLHSMLYNLLTQIWSELCFLARTILENSLSLFTMTINTILKQFRNNISRFIFQMHRQMIWWQINWNIICSLNMMSN